VEHALARQQGEYDLVQAIDRGIEQALDSLLLEQKGAHRGVTLDLQPSLRHRNTPWCGLLPECYPKSGLSAITTAVMQLPPIDCPGGIGAFTPRIMARLFPLLLLTGGGSEQMQQAGEQVVDRNVQANGRHNVVRLAAVDDVAGLEQDQAGHQQHKYGRYRERQTG